MIVSIDVVIWFFLSPHPQAFEVAIERVLIRIICVTVPCELTPQLTLRQPAIAKGKLSVSKRCKKSRATLYLHWEFNRKIELELLRDYWGQRLVREWGHQEWRMLVSKREGAEGGVIYRLACEITWLKSALKKQIMYFEHSTSRYVINDKSNERTGEYLNNYRKGS